MSAKNIAFSLLGVVLLAGGAGGAYWYGNQPIKEYYPNGAVKSVSERQMYEKTGKFQLFAQDGSKILECNQQKGIKNGAGEIFFSGGSINVNYQNDKLSGPVSVNSAQYGEYLKDIKLSIDNSVLKITGGENAEATAAVSCSDNDFVMNMREFLNVQNYNTFKSFFGCLNFNAASFAIDGGKCTYQGAYQFPRFLADTKTVCEITNQEFLEGFTESFNAMSDLSASMSAVNGTMEFNPGHLSKVKSFKLGTDYKIADNKFTFFSTTETENAIMEQKGSFGGLEKLIEDGAEFAFSAKSDDDAKKMVLSFLQNMTWSDWDATINGRKRFTITGDFNFLSGFSDPYVMAYYSNNEVTTQWKINAKGMQLTSKYPNTSIPLFSFGMSINDHFKKAYKALVQDGLDVSFGGASAFDSAKMGKLQKEAEELVKGINSFSTVFMNPNGEKTIYAAVSLAKNFTAEQLMMSPEQFLNFKVVTYQNDKPLKSYEGNMVAGFKLNGKPIPAEQYEAESQYLMKVLKNSFAEIMTELEKSYKDIDENSVSWIDNDIDPFLYGLYKGYSLAEDQMEELDVSVTDELSMIIINVQTLFKENPENYKELNNDTAVKLGIIRTVGFDMSPVNSFDGKIVLKASNKTTSDVSNGAFVVASSEIPDEKCVEFLTMGVHLIPQESLIALSAGNMGAAPQGFTELNKIATDSPDSVGNADVAKGFIAAKKDALANLLTEENAAKICSGGEKGNFIAVKYY